MNKSLQSPFQGERANFEESLLALLKYSQICCFTFTYSNCKKF
jgi:hypothetical protein